MTFSKQFFSALLASTALGAAFTIAPAPASADSEVMDDTYQWHTFEDVDVDRSGFVEDGEYYSYAFGMADWDNDGYLEDTEWVSFTETFHDDWDLDQEAYTEYDTDGDGMIEFVEYADAANDADLIDDWDFNDDDAVDPEDWDQVRVKYYDDE